MTAAPAQYVLTYWLRDSVHGWSPRWERAAQRRHLDARAADLHRSGLATDIRIIPPTTPQEPKKK
jgi:hypothetical protein